ncbi:hypothetical protein CU097_003235, partial [Rhizopus azygosporus]
MSHFKGEKLEDKQKKELSSLKLNSIEPSVPENCKLNPKDTKNDFQESLKKLTSTKTKVSFVSFDGSNNHLCISTTKSAKRALFVSYLNAKAMKN